MLGAQALNPEESTSFTLGAVINPLPNTSVTIDYYNIDIEDRLALRNNTIGAEVTDIAPNTVNATRVFDFENQVPNQRSTLTFDYDTGGMLQGYLRFNRYGDWESTGG
ncbi:TonB-dependent receptor [Microbulbifer sp.]|uniref:TonB-dependent receptor n=1 Tax=Microbulbifer sp. TaxID=1908541 RepID=UPI0025861A9C|nr:TonB-dependent receptor [Microbulbifer sp.]